MALVEYDSDSTTSRASSPALAVVSEHKPPALPSVDEALAAAAEKPPEYLRRAASVPDIDYKTVSAQLEAQAAASNPPSNSSEAAEAAADAGRRHVDGSDGIAAGEKRRREEHSSGGVAARAEARATADAKDMHAQPRKRPQMVGTALAPSSAAASGDRAAAKVTVKDRTKHQRLAGQSGIGEDFRTWRSDEEMVLRQQFD